MPTPLLEQLINQLRRLPGVGIKSAQRMAFQLLSRDREGGKQLAQVLLKAMTAIQECEACRSFSEQALCSICQSTKRDPHLLCIVETPADLAAIEQTGYQGRYFVLHGRLSPIDGIGPHELGIDKLKHVFQTKELKEIILATNTTVEGEATAHYIAQIAKQWQIPCSRIAYGVPLGGELEYLDGGTLSRAFAGREIL